MQIVRTKDGTFIISGLEPPLGEIFAAIPEAADPGDSAAARRRLYPAPSLEREICEEWREYVEPGLRDWFQSAVEIVQSDLRPLQEGGETLTIEPEHVDAWLNALNQARLSLAARFAVADPDMELALSPVIRHERERQREWALFQIHFYDLVQERLIRGIEGD